MQSDALAYRFGLVETGLLLVLFLLAFGAITVIGRERWLSLGASESLLVRLAAAVLIGSIGVGGLSGVVINLMQGIAFSDSTLPTSTSRNQALLGIALLLALTIVGVIRIELYHRRLLSPPAQEEDADWKVEPPEIAGRR